MKKNRTKSGGSSKSDGAGDAVFSPASPKTGTYGIPTGFFLALGVLAYIGHAELGYHSGEFSPGVYEPYANAKSIPRVGEVSRVDAGRDVYAQMCQACHQPNGSGNPANGCPPVAGSDWVLAEGPARLIRIVLHGGTGPIKVNDKEWGSATGMLAFKDALNDEQVAAVVTFLRQAPEWKNEASEVTPEMVKAVREKTATRNTQWTEAELLKVPVTE